MQSGNTASAAALVLLIGALDILQRSNKVIQNLGRHHNAVAVGAHLLGDAHHTPAGIALQVNEKGLAVSNDFLCANDIVVHCF